MLFHNLVCSNLLSTTYYNELLSKKSSKKGWKFSAIQKKWLAFWVLLIIIFL